MDERSAGLYWELTKPRVVSLIVFTAVVGLFLAVPGLMPLRESVFGLLGIWLAAASAAAIKHLIDPGIDKVMVRTAYRPLATGTRTCLVEGKGVAVTQLYGVTRHITN